MTAQELSSLCRRSSNAIVLLLNNDGYTTERVIHEGPNDIELWAYHKAARHDGDVLDDALVCAKAMTDGPALIEIMLERFDTSEALKRLGAALSPQKGERDDHRCNVALL